MFSKIVSLAFLTVLAGRAFADVSFNVSVNGNTVFAPAILNFTYTPVLEPCGSQCNTTRNLIAPCNANASDFSCFCQTNVTSALQTCEQCLFQNLVEQNARADVLAGSNQVLAGWVANCATINVTVALATSLQNITSWDGPFVAVFPTAIGWVIAVTGGLLGSSLIYMLCNM